MRYLALIFYSIICFSVSNLYANGITDIFEHEQQTQLLMDIEAAMAQAQAKNGVIPQWAADEIQNKADASLISATMLGDEFQIVRHRMVAFLNVWSRQMDKGAEQYLHFGATTVDIYDTLLVLQLLKATDHFILAQRAIEEQLMVIADKHKTTPMVGRTLGQHALPITFGKKVSGWLGENRRHIERLKSIRIKLRKSAILKGAVGSYLGLGDQAIAVEKDFATFLDLDQPYSDDWHGSRDVLADYALTLALASKSYSRWGQEIFLMQSTDLAEVLEQRSSSAVSSSSMPHKNNPSRSEALLHHGRTIPRLAEVLLDDVVNFYERDNTSRPNRTMAGLTTAAASMFRDTQTLLRRIQINETNMKNNLNRTDGMLTSQRLVMALAPAMGKQVANDLIHQLAKQAFASEARFVDVLIADKVVSKYLSAQQIRDLTDSSTYLGLDVELVENVISDVKAARNTDPVK